MSHPSFELFPLFNPCDSSPPGSRAVPVLLSLPCPPTTSSCSGLVLCHRDPHPAFSVPAAVHLPQGPGDLLYLVLTLPLLCSQPSLVPCHPRIKSQPLSLALEAPHGQDPAGLLASAPTNPFPATCLQPHLLCSCPQPFLQLSPPTRRVTRPPLVCLSGTCLL